MHVCLHLGPLKHEGSQLRFVFPFDFFFERWKQQSCTSTVAGTHVGHVRECFPEVHLHQGVPIARDVAFEKSPLINGAGFLVVVERICRHNVASLGEVGREGVTISDGQPPPHRVGLPPGQN
jgi:hypothetical protein